MEITGLVVIIIATLGGIGGVIKVLHDAFTK